MNTYIDSSKITAFPVGRRQGNNNANGTLLTESRLSSLVNSLLDINGFVVSPKFGQQILNEDGSLPIEVNIKGRYFKIDAPYESLGLSNGTSVGDSIYVGIKIDSSSGDLYSEVDGIDTDGNYPYKYTGLMIFDSVTLDNNDNTYTNGDYTCVKVVEWDGNHWVIPEPNYSKINFIDGGELEEQQQVNDEE